MAVGDASVSWLSHTSTNTTFLSKVTNYFLTCFCRSEWQKYAGNKSPLNRESNSRPPGQESDTLTTELPRRGDKIKDTVVRIESTFRQQYFQKHEN